LKLPLESLREIEAKIELRFETEHGRRPELADKIKKTIEETGEVIKAVKNESRERQIDEIADWALSVLSTGFLLGFSDQEIRDGFTRTITKLNERWKMLVVPEARLRPTLIGGVSDMEWKEAFKRDKDAGYR